MHVFSCRLSALSACLPLMSLSRSRSRSRPTQQEQTTVAKPTQQSALQKGKFVVKLPSGGLCLEPKRTRPHQEHEFTARAAVADAVCGVAAKPSQQLPHEGFEVVMLPSGGLCMAASGPSSGETRASAGKGKGKWPGWPMCEKEDKLANMHLLNIKPI